MLLVKNLEKSFDSNVIFKNLNFSVQDGEKVAVVGLNGAGKSTLFRILLNQIDSDAGEFYMGKSPCIGWMPQTIDELNLPDDVIVYDFFLATIFLHSWLSAFPFFRNSSDLIIFFLIS